MGKPYCTCGKPPKLSVEKAFNGVWLTLADGREFIHEKANITRMGMWQGPDGLCHIYLGINGEQPTRYRAGKKRATRKLLENMVALKYGSFSAIPGNEVSNPWRFPCVPAVILKKYDELYDPAYAGVPLIVERIAMFNSRIGPFPSCTAYDLIYCGRVLDSASANSIAAMVHLRAQLYVIEQSHFQTSSDASVDC